MTTYRKPNSHRLLFLVNASLLCIVLALAANQSLKMVSIVVLSFATGLLNPSLPRIGSESVSLTFVTGILSRIGNHLALAARGVALPGAEGPWGGHFHRACLDAYVWTGFFIGAIVSGVLLMHAQQFVLPIAIAAIVGFGVFSRAADASAAQSKKASD